MEMKVDIDVLDNDGWTPLHAAVYWRNMEAAELLVSHGADITLVTSSVSMCECVLHNYRLGPMFV